MADRSLRPSVGLVLCLLPAAYFVLTCAYALLNAPAFAADTPRLLRYVVGPSVLALGLIAAGVFLREEGARTVGVGAVSILSALFLFEGFLTARALSGQMGLLGNIEEEIAPDDEVRSNLPPAYTLKAINAELGITSLDQAVLSNSPGSTVLLCSRNREAVTYTTDRYGFRNPDSVHENPTSLLVLGDSFVEGICLPDGEDVASRIRARVPETVALGTRGSGPLFHLALLGRYGPELRPPVTLIAFFAGNDWENLAGEGRNPSLINALTPGADFGPVILPPQDRAAAEAVVAGWWDAREPPLGELLSRRAVIRNFAALQQTASVLGLHYRAGSSDQPIFSDVLERAKDVVAEWEGELILAYISPVDRYVGLLDASFVHDPLRDRVIGAANAAGVDVIDLTVPFDAAESPMRLYAPDAHFSPAGADLAAETIVTELRARGLLASP